MRLTTIAIAALLTASVGPAFGQSNAPSMNETRTNTAAPVGPSSPSVTPGSGAAQNPLVNPSAAGTQTGWRGYGANSSAPTNGASGPAADMPPSREPLDERHARERLQQLGYGHVTGLHQSAQGGWEARATWDNREVAVRLDRNGSVVAQR